MNRHQLKNSLHELSPSLEQKQAMLRNIRQAKPQRFQLRRLVPLAATVLLVLGLIRIWPAMTPTMDKRMAEPNTMATEALMIEDSNVEAAQMEMVGVADPIADYERQLAETPWKPEQTPSQLPMVRLAEGVQADTDANLTAYDQAIVDYLFPQMDGSLGRQLLDLQPVISIDQAKARAIAMTPGLVEGDIIDGLLTYQALADQPMDYVPVYLIRYQATDRLDILTIDARQ